MPYKDPAKKKAHALAFQKVWMVKKIHERKALGICRVSGCGVAICAESVQYCERHREENRLNSKAYRDRKKELACANQAVSV